MYEKCYWTKEFSQSSALEMCIIQNFPNFGKLSQFYEPVIIVTIVAIYFEFCLMAYCY
jgi:hypothetical protein